MQASSKRVLRGLLIAAAVLGPLSASAGMFFELGPNTVVFPPQSSALRFNHELHAGKRGVPKTMQVKDASGVYQTVTTTKGFGLDCETCHEHVSTQEKAAQRDIPGHEACSDCHDESDESAPRDQCAMCHTDLRAASTATVARGMRIPAPNIKFAHAQHLKAGVACASCHASVPKKDLATRDDYPTMDRCIACHQEKSVSVECKTCHLTLPSGRVQTHFAAGVLKPSRYHSYAIHDGDFLRAHAVPAQRDKAYCKNCHAESDCLQCHDGVGRDARYHPGDWIAMHGIRAKKDDYRCESCHRLQSFCTNCHLRSGVATAGDLANPLVRRTIRLDPLGALDNDGRVAAIGPHPMAADGWLETNSPNFHGFYAQRNIRACASCHQEQYCIRCHGSFDNTLSRRTSGDKCPNFQDCAGKNPHGPNPERLKGSTASLRTARACLKCHNPADPLWR